MSSFDLLPLPIKKIIYDLGWQQLTKIQAAAIDHIVKTDFNYILCSKTASGKTEAVFLPILSKLERKKNGVKVIYLSPLIALINDQFERLDRLCKYLDIKVTKWHGEASISQKKKLIVNPEGLLLITPESLESLFVNKPHLLLKLFSDTEFIVVDEIHSFLNSKRGVQLRSLIYRLQEKIGRKIRFFGLSATLGEYDNVKNFIGDYTNTKVLLDKSQKEVDVKFKYFFSKNFDIPIELITDLYTEICKKKSLVFPNSRAKVEEIAIKLKRISASEKGHLNYFAHHSSVSKELRLFAEKYAKENYNKFFSIVCTNTLELGIDIGSVDLICQVNSTYSVSSLAQRFGRSGRREDLKSHLFLYATNEWMLLQAIACIELYKESSIEPLEHIKYPIDLVLHQTLSILKETNGITKAVLVKRLSNNFAFKSIDLTDIDILVDYLIIENYIEKVGTELILGLKSERFFTKGDFYAVFETEKSFRVYYKEKFIGELQDVTEFMIGENFYLSAQIWKIKEIDFRLKKVLVVPAPEGREPVYYSSLPNIQELIRKKMLSILFSRNEYNYLDEKSNKALIDLRRFFSLFKIQNCEFERPVAFLENKCHFYTFTSSKINSTIQLLSAIMDIKTSLIEYKSCIIFGNNANELQKIIGNFINIIENINEYFGEFVKKNPDYLSNLEKWENLLPIELKKKVWINNYLDIDGTKEFLSNVKIVTS
ncbi:MAG: DEAD/DEAH box helicase [Ignavibacteria bacterium]|jgi:ATP-dependent Lhr-like helicase